MPNAVTSPRPRPYNQGRTASCSSSKAAVAPPTTPSGSSTRPWPSSSTTPPRPGTGGQLSARGSHLDTELNLANTSVEWSAQPAPQTLMRYRADITGDQWDETARLSTDHGTTWTTTLRCNCTGSPDLGPRDHRRLTRRPADIASCAKSSPSPNMTYPAKPSGSTTMACRTIGSGRQPANCPSNDDERIVRVGTVRTTV